MKLFINDTMLKVGTGELFAIKEWDELSPNLGGPHEPSLCKLRYASARFFAELESHLEISQLASKEGFSIDDLTGESLETFCAILAKSCCDSWAIVLTEKEIRSLGRWPAVHRNNIDLSIFQPPLVDNGSLRFQAKWRVGERTQEVWQLEFALCDLKITYQEQVTAWREKMIRVVDENGQTIRRDYFS